MIINDSNSDSNFHELPAGRTQNENNNQQIVLVLMLYTSLESRTKKNLKNPTRQAISAA